MSTLSSSSSTALRGPRSQQINLVDPQLLHVREQLSGRRLLTLLAIGTTLVGLHYAVEQYRLQREIVNLATQSALAENNSGGTPATTASPLLSKQEQLKREEALRQALSQGGDLPTHTGALMTAVAQALPDTIWLTDLQVLGEKSLVISGGTLERPALAVFAQQLEASTALKGTPIGVLQLEPRAGRNDRGSGLGAGDDLPSATTSDGQSAPVTTHFAFTLASRTVSGLPTALTGDRP